MPKAHRAQRPCFKPKDGDNILKIAKDMRAEIKLWDADMRQHHRPKLKQLINDMCEELKLIAIGNMPIG